MKAIKTILVAALATVSSAAFAQGIPGGAILMGGTLGFSSSGSSTTVSGTSIPEYEASTGSQFQFSLAPKLGYFFADNFAAGMTINFSTSSRTTKQNDNPLDTTDAPSENTESETQLLAGPFFRYYYFPSRRVGIFGEVEIGVGAGSTGGDQNTVSAGQFSFGVGPGLTFFANDIVAIEALLKYNLLTQNQSYTVTNPLTNTSESRTSKIAISKIDFGVGFQFYFNRVIGGNPGAGDVN